ncbi:MAG: glutamine amidotransferase class-I [Proteobacteria bacterium]|nr:glutamine amidotransferase class-I [Pseudomonadota bacterium]
MNPIAVFQHSPNVDPGYFASFLDAQNIPWQHIRVDQGDTIPDSPVPFSGLCFMGGVMSVNDPLPWIPEALRLIQQAVEAGIPVIGHCLGGQLLSKALGGIVARNPAPEIGWGRVSVAKNPVSTHWFGELEDFSAFHWHGDGFSVPAGATQLLTNPHSANQAFAQGPHLGMQCHVEMTEELIRTWNQEWSTQTLQCVSYPESVQPTSLQLAQMPVNLPAMRSIAHRLYVRWLENVRTD